VTDAPKSKSSNWLTGALVLALLIGAILMGFEEARAGLPDDQQAPAFTFEKLAGGELASAQLGGKVVLLDFWATWCPPCREEMPWLVSLAGEYGPKGVELVAVSHDDPEDAKEAIEGYLQKIPELRPYVVLQNRAVAALFKVRAFPTLYVIDREGKIVASHTGQTSERNVRRWLDEALERKPSSAEVTR
jgi:thiol-disulfide isomerase/thioredoxin